MRLYTISGELSRRDQCIYSISDRMTRIIGNVCRLAVRLVGCRRAYSRSKVSTTGFFYVLLRPL
jgi:hypothetical protein